MTAPPLELDDIQATVDRLKADGFELVGAIGVYDNDDRVLDRF